jgi:hypothetical protein
MIPGDCAAHRSDRFRRLAPALTCVLLLAVMSGCAKREVELPVFQDATQGSGLEAYVGMTHGAAWGDFDGDGQPDVYVTNHLSKTGALLFRNLGGGKFADVTRQYFGPDPLLGDKHGAEWGDFDNDGRLDLVQLTGAIRGVGVEPKRLWHNLGDHFVDVALPAGVRNPESRARDPLWVDLDNDGKLDLFEGAEKRFDDKTPPFVIMQTPAGFTGAEHVLPLAGRSAPFCEMTKLVIPGPLQLICRIEQPTVAVQVFDLKSLPAKTLDALPQTAFEDAAVADFDNDGQLDVFLARRNPAGPVAFGRPSGKQLVADVAINAANVGQLMGFSFRAKGPVQVEVEAPNPGDLATAERIHIGAAGAQPSAMNFSAGTEIGAAPKPVPGAQSGVYLGFTAPDQWDVRVTAPRESFGPGKTKTQEVQLRITAGEPITKVQAEGTTEVDEAAPARLFMNHGGKLVEESDKRGVNKRLVAGASVVAGDFNNDMHEDLFVVASGEFGQQQNLLLLNDGTGHFQVVKGAGGAAGVPSGVGESVTTADFEGNGCLDLLIANGGSMGRSWGLPAERGGYRLYRNLCNSGNHWLEIDLQGTRSNRDGIGAVVKVTAGGVTQTQLQGGGMHRGSQNQARLHFGLAKNASIDKITVHWPSGTVQEMQAVSSDQVLKIKEPAASS